MPRKKEPEFFVATTSGVLNIAGHRETFIAGRTIVSKDAPLFRAYPHLFKAIDHPVIEQATAAPGEKRG